MQVLFVVGKNGAGKSRYLIEQARLNTGHCIYICNTVHDNSSVLRKAIRFSAKSYASRPDRVIKSALIKIFQDGYHRLNVLHKVLTHCGYDAAFTVNIKRNFDLVDVREKFPSARLLELERVIEAMMGSETSISEVVHLTVEINHSRLSQLAFFLENEKELSRFGLIKSIGIDLHTKQRGFIPLSHASSGELSLMTSLIFVLLNIREGFNLYIDEPENSLHPQWQRSYVALLLDLLPYHEGHVLIATHSPLIVTGAQLDRGARTEFYHPETGKIELQSTANLEEILWGQFDTLMPESSVLSEEISRKLHSLWAKEASLSEVVDFLNSAKEISFDPRQDELFSAAERLARKINMEPENAQ